MIFMPWHQAHYDLLSQQADADQLAHAWLCAGSQGLGKVAFVRQMAQSLLCHKPEGGQACGQCPSCHCFVANHHPDWHEVSCLEGIQSIGVDQIRAMSARLVKTPAMSPRHIVCIHPAERMQSAGMNALLKTLEEPASNALLFLVSHQPGLLPMTILSRVQTLRFADPGAQAVIPWLMDQGVGEQMAEKAYTLCQSPMGAWYYANDVGLQQHYAILLKWLCARQEPWHFWVESLDGKASIAQLLHLMLRIISEIFKIMGAKASTWLQVTGLEMLPQDKLWQMHKTIMDAYPLLKAGSGVVPQGVAESVCLVWQQTFEGISMDYRL